MKKNKHVIIPILFIVLITMFSSCSKNTRFLVKIPIKNKKAVDFNSYKKIIYKDIILESAPKNYDPKPEIQNFFVYEFAQLIKKEIHHVPSITKNNTESPDNPMDEEHLKQILKENPDSLIITGKLIFDIKSRSRLQEVKDKQGKKKKEFVKIEHWTINLDLRLIDSNSGKPVFERKFESRLKDAFPTKSRFNFKSTFNKATDRFLKLITRKGSFQKRYLLLK